MLLLSMLKKMMIDVLHCHMNCCKIKEQRVYYSHGVSFLLEATKLNVYSILMSHEGGISIFKIFAKVSFEDCS